jgi:hypothetical protein
MGWARLAWAILGALSAYWVSDGTEKALRQSQ